ncbi:MAG TPA: J domain-containing protein [Vicinamibacterales bacterium]|nr:J domain-containing protein [Vicinamibacterales bacterium]
MTSPEIDYYETLQISPNAELDTIHRVYRLLAQRFHPDNQETGDADRFRLVTAAYQALCDPELRASYDAVRRGREQQRSRLLSETVRPDTDVHAEQLLRMTLLQVLYTRRRLEPRTPGIFEMDLESLVGHPREHLEFTLWYLGQRGLIERTDGSRIMITADGVDHMERQPHTIHSVRRLTAAPFESDEDEETAVA